MTKSLGSFTYNVLTILAGVLVALAHIFSLEEVARKLERLGAEPALELSWKSSSSQYHMCRHKALKSLM